jgi:hypothetical protein
MIDIEKTVVTLKYTLQDINELINMMNKPFAVPVLAWANYINDIQLQLKPQIEKLNEEQNEQKD